MNKKYFILGLVFAFLGAILLNISAVSATYTNQSDGFPVSVMNVYSGHLKYNGTYFVFAEPLNDKVYVINNSGSMIYNISIPNEGGSQQSLAFNGSNIFLLISGVIYNYNISGTHLNNFSIEISGTPLTFENYGGLSTNGSNDFWFLDGNQSFIQHLNSSGSNLTDGFSIKNATATANVITDFTMYGSEIFLISNVQDFVYHLSNGVNQSDGFSLSSLGIASGSGIATNDSKNIWIMDNSDLFIYHFSNITTNNAPTITNLQFNETNATAFHNNFINASGTINDADGGLLNGTLSIFKNKILTWMQKFLNVGSGYNVSFIINGSDIAPGDNLTAQINVTDGTALTYLNSTELYINGSISTITNISIQPNLTYSEISLNQLNCTANVFDNDLDKMNVSFNWYLNNNRQIAFYGNASNVNNGSLAYAPINITNSSLGGVYICGVKAYDGFSFSNEYNSTEIDIYENSTVISAITTNPSNKGMFTNITLQSTIQPGIATNITWANFSLWHESSRWINYRNGTINQNSNLWNSSDTFVINQSGTYTAELIVRTNKNATFYKNSTFSITDQVNINPFPNASITALQQINETLAFNISISHNSVSNESFSLNNTILTNSSGSNMASFFNISYDKNSTNFFDKSSFLITLNISNNTQRDVYKINFTLNRSIDNQQYNTQLFILIDPPSGLPVTYAYNDFTKICNAGLGFDEGCDLQTSIFNTQSVPAKQWTIRNDGQFALTGCLPYLTNDLNSSTVLFKSKQKASDDYTAIQKFDLAINSIMHIESTIFELQTRATPYYGTLNIVCEKGTPGGLFSVSTNSTNRPEYLITVSTLDQGSTGGGVTGGVTTIILPPTAVSKCNQTDLKWNISSLNGENFISFDTIPGKSRTTEFLLKNNGSLTINLNLNCIGEQCSRLKLNENTAQLIPISEKRIRFTSTSKVEDISGDIYSYNIQAKDSNDCVQSIQVNNRITYFFGLLSNSLNTFDIEFINKLDPSFPIFRIPNWIIVIFMILFFTLFGSYILSKITKNPSLSAVIMVIFSLLISILYLFLF